MKNELFHIGPFTVYGYGLMIAIGILAAYYLMEKRAKKLGLDQDRVFSMVLVCLIGGGIGSKLLYYITMFPQILEDPSMLLDFQNGWVVYGGLIGGIAAGILYCRVKKFSFLAYFDLAMPSVALAQAFGRIGCFLAGCCYGRETACPVAVTFQNSLFAPNGVSLIPTQLYSSALNFLHFFVLLWIARHKKADGQVAGFYLIFYSVGRYIIEIFRGDLGRGSVGIFSTSQFIALFMVLAGVALVWITGRRKRVENSKEAGNADTERGESAGK